MAYELHLSERKEHEELIQILEMNLQIYFYMIQKAYQSRIILSSTKFAFLIDYIFEKFLDSRCEIVENISCSWSETKF